MDRKKVCGKINGGWFDMVLTKCGHSVGINNYYEVCYFGFLANCFPRFARAKNIVGGIPIIQEECFWPMVLDVVGKERKSWWEDLLDRTNSGLNKEIESMWHLASPFHVGGRLVRCYSDDGEDRYYLFLFNPDYLKDWIYTLSLDVVWSESEGGVL
jgi:hypothetical protein